MPGECYEVMLAMVPELEVALQKEPSELTDPPARVVRGVSERVGFAFTVDVLVDPGASQLSPPITAYSVDDIREGVQWQLEQSLSPRVRGMLDQWQRRGVWTFDFH